MATTTTVSIGSCSRSGDDISAAWIAEQTRIRQRDGEVVCAEVRVVGDDIDLLLWAGECGGTTRRGGRPLTPAEQEVVALWIKHHLSEKAINPGRLEAFAKQVARL
jgi:hypothetical protein